MTNTGAGTTVTMVIKVTQHRLQQFIRARNAARLLDASVTQSADGNLIDFCPRLHSRTAHRLDHAVSVLNSDMLRTRYECSNMNAIASGL